MCSWYQRPAQIFLAVVGGASGTAPVHAEMNRSFIAIVRLVIFVFAVKYSTQCIFTKQSQAQINIFGGRMSLSKTEECF